LIPFVILKSISNAGQNFIYVHLNRVIKKYDLDMVYVSGPGHGGPAVVANAYLEGTYSEIYPNISQDEAGLRKLFIQFSFPGGIPSHASPECPGSIHEDSELGYSLSHSFGAVFDNPDLVVACVVGDGEAETGPLATAWHSNKFLNPVSDRAVLPIVPSPGAGGMDDTHVLGRFLRDVAKLNSERRNFRVFAPDETLSNGLEALFEVIRNWKWKWSRSN
jgi:xylulose-5-phosphate/fructose-6-phosphate phosphoketolase